MVRPFENSISVWPSAGDFGGAGDARHAGTVLDDHLLAPGLGELLADGAGEDVGHAAGRDRHDDADLLAGKCLRLRGAASRQRSGESIATRTDPAATIDPRDGVDAAALRDRRSARWPASRPVAAISSRIARRSCSLICSSGVRTGPPAMPSISDHALIAAIGSTWVSCQRPCSQRLATARASARASPKSSPPRRTALQAPARCSRASAARRRSGSGTATAEDWCTRWPCSRIIIRKSVSDGELMTILSPHSCCTAR